MKLNFLGCGAAFNPKFGNNSAFFTDNDELFLIDCGELVFCKIIDDLKKYKFINVMITHTHGDHIGSLASLILYCKFVLGISVRIIIGKGCKHRDSIKKILNLMGCDDFEFVLDELFDNRYESFNSLRYKETKHVDKLSCYSLVFDTNDGIVYYSGDTKELDTLISIIKRGKEIDKLYIDTCSVVSSPHVYIGDLVKKIPRNIRNKVYCMHFDNEKCIDMALENGFNVIKNRN